MRIKKCEDRLINITKDKCDGGILMIEKFFGGELKKQIMKYCKKLESISLEYDIFIQKLVLQKVLSNFYEDLSNVNNKHILLILEQIKKRKTGNVLNLPNSVSCIMEYDKMKFFKDKNNDFEYELELVDGLLLPNGMKFLEYNGKSNGNDIIRLSSSEVQLPLIVRNKRNGDVIELKGTNGKKKVSDIFIDLKINKLERASYPVVVDSRGIIVWVPKLKKSKYDSQNDKMCDIIFKCL